MGFFDVFKINAALKLHQKGDLEGALKAYEELYKAGFIRAFYLLPYSVLLLRKGGEENFLKVKEILRAAEKASDLTPEKRQQLQMNYAVAQYALGELEKAVNLLEASHRKNPCGLIYQALGFLYIELGDPEKALAYNTEALDYDDEDPVVLDNVGQMYYRLLNDKEKALEYFKKAHELKDSAIDTLYFLAKYDIENGDCAAAKEKLEKALGGNFSPLNYATRDKVNELLAGL